MHLVQFAAEGNSMTTGKRELYVFSALLILLYLVVRHRRKRNPLRRNRSSPSTGKN